MKTMDWNKIEWVELGSEELMQLNGGQSLLYYLSYDVGVLFGTAAKVADKIVESLYYSSVTTLLK